MAVTFSTTINKSVRSWKWEGLVMVQVNATCSAGGATDYPSNGIVLSTNSKKFGLRTIFEVFAVTHQTSVDGTMKTLPAVGFFDAKNGTLRLYCPSATGQGLTEISAGTVSAGDVFRFTAYGV